MPASLLRLLVPDSLARPTKRLDSFFFTQLSQWHFLTDIDLPEYQYQLRDISSNNSSASGSHHQCWIELCFMWSFASGRWAEVQERQVQWERQKCKNCGFEMMLSLYLLAGGQLEILRDLPRKFPTATAASEKSTQQNAIVGFQWIHQMLSVVKLVSNRGEKAKNYQSNKRFFTLPFFCF